MKNNIIPDENNSIISDLIETDCDFVNYKEFEDPLYLMLNSARAIYEIEIGCILQVGTTKDYNEKYVSLYKESGLDLVVKEKNLYVLAVEICSPNNECWKIFNLSNKLKYITIVK